MNSKLGQHDREHLDLVFLYALQALPTSEIQAVEAHISSCADCRQEIETLQPRHRVIDLELGRDAEGARQQRFDARIEFFARERRRRRQQAEIGE